MYNLIVLINSVKIWGKDQTWEGGEVFRNIWPHLVENLRIIQDEWGFVSLCSNFIITRQAKDVVRGIKKRLGSRNAKVQLLALTVSSFCSPGIYFLVWYHVWRLYLFIIIKQINRFLIINCGGSCLIGVGSRFFLFSLIKNDHSWSLHLYEDKEFDYTEMSSCFPTCKNCMLFLEEIFALNINHVYTLLM